MKYTKENIYLVGPHSPDLNDKLNVHSLAVYDNLGHVGDYITAKRTGRLCGWTSGVVYGMIHAYVNGVDFIYKEQDCLWFGDCIETMYNEIKDNGIIYGNNKVMGVAQSLFLVKRDYIPSMIAELSTANDADVLPETKFAGASKGTKFSFGYDRDRPFNIKDHCWYIQQITDIELQALKSENLINYE
jgi:hypothetical protein